MEKKLLFTALENESRMNDFMFEELKKFRKALRLKGNKMTGKMMEDNYKLARSLQGYEVKRTGRGHDFVERKVDWLTGRKGPRKYVEVKSSSTAPLSRLQKKIKKKGNYEVVRPLW